MHDRLNHGKCLFEIRCVPISFPDLVEQFVVLEIRSQFPVTHIQKVRVASMPEKSTLLFRFCRIRFLLIQPFFVYLILS